MFSNVKDYVKNNEHNLGLFKKYVRSGRGGGAQKSVRKRERGGALQITYVCSCDFLRVITCQAS